MLNNVICAIDALGSATSTADNSLPAFPEENPDQVALATWLDKWDAYVASQGYMPMLSAPLRDRPQRRGFRPIAD